MQITTNYTTSYKTQSRPSFGWIPICHGKVIKNLSDGIKKEIPVDICLIRKEDKPFLSSILPKWRDDSLYGYAIIHKFLTNVAAEENSLHKYNYFMIMPTPEASKKPTLLSKFLALSKIKNTPKKDLLQKPIQEPLCMAEVERLQDGFELTYIQTSPDIITYRQTKAPKSSKFTESILNNSNILSPDTTKPFSGSGQMLLYGISRFINSTKNNKLKILSANDNFYKKIFNKSPNEKEYIHLNSEEITDFIQKTQEKYRLEDTKTTLKQELIDEINNNVLGKELTE